ncbi:MAG TPA: hypothetical protein VLT90_03790 [Terriglobales bacterium]|nr:hypothetical protein [Terriglobales bacterium]
MAVRKTLHVTSKRNRQQVVKNANNKDAYDVLNTAYVPVTIHSHHPPIVKAQRRGEAPFAEAYYRYSTMLQKAGGEESRSDARRSRLPSLSVVVSWQFRESNTHRPATNL